MAPADDRRGPGRRPDAPEPDGAESIIARFEADCWRAASAWPAIEPYLAGDGDARRRLLVELVLVDLELRRERGRAACLADLLARFPELLDDADAMRSIRGLAGIGSTEGPGPDPPPLPAAIPGRVGRFELLELVGAGGNGLVYRARDPRLDRIVALKLPRREWVGTSAEVARFVREARTAAGLRHPGIVSVFEVGEADGRAYLACEFIAGSTLARRIDGRPLPPRQAAKIVAQMAEALDYAHRNAVIHRDIKPNNILMDEEGRPHLADFGLAKSLREDQTLTDDGQMLGTPAYMSPEQARGETALVGPRSDVYSLGVVLFESLTGERPFRGHPRSILQQLQHDDPRPPRRLNPDVPPDLDAICLTAMAPAPSERYATAGAFAEDLNRFLRGETVRARSAGSLRRIARAARRRPLVAGLCLAVVGVAALGFAGVFWQWRVAQGHFEAERAQNRRLYDAISGANALIGNMALRLVEDYPTISPETPALRQEHMDKLIHSYQVYLKGIPDDLGPDRYYSSALINLARIYELAGRDAEAEEAWVAAADRFRGESLEHPDRIELYSYLLRAQYGLAMNRFRVGPPARSNASLEELIRSIDERERIADRYPIPRSLRAQADNYLGRALYKLGENLFECGEFGAALPHFERCLAIRAREARADAGVRPLTALWLAQVQVGRTLDRLGRFREAHRAFVEADAVIRRLRALEPDSALHKARHAMCEHVIGNLLEDLGRFDEAIASMRRAEAIRIEVVRGDPGNPGHLADLEGTRGRIREITAAKEAHEAGALAGTVALARCGPD